MNTLTRQIERSWRERAMHYQDKADTELALAERETILMHPFAAQWHRKNALSFRVQAELITQTGMREEIRESRKRVKDGEA